MKDALLDGLGADVLGDVVPAVAEHLEALEQEQGLLVGPLVAQVLERAVDLDKVGRGHVRRVLARGEARRAHVHVLVQMPVPHHRTDAPAHRAQMLQQTTFFPSETRFFPIKSTFRQFRPILADKDWVERGSTLGSVAWAGSGGLMLGMMVGCSARLAPALVAGCGASAAMPGAPDLALGEDGAAPGEPAGTTGAAPEGSVDGTGAGAGAAVEVVEVDDDDGDVAPGAAAAVGGCRAPYLVRLTLDGTR